ncbi:MAG: YabP/YqfC family sporulation protein [Lachnospiraceae bacterium]|nr:YabP/YqfC family sporulation protein [Lachnospiraceae bacterium]
MNKKNLKLKDNIKSQMVECLQLPKDLVLGASIITVTGNQDIYIENYKGIIEYTSDTILIQGKKCQICIEGMNLSIDYYTDEDMKISGKVEHIHYI